MSGAGVVYAMAMYSVDLLGSSGVHDASLCDLGGSLSCRRLYAGVARCFGACLGPVQAAGQRVGGGVTGGSSGCFLAMWPPCSSFCSGTRYMGGISPGSSSGWGWRFAMMRIRLEMIKTERDARVSGRMPEKSRCSL